jgi:hypothetical protein
MPRAPGQRLSRRQQTRRHPALGWRAHGAACLLCVKEGVWRAVMSRSSLGPADLGRQRLVARLHVAFNPTRSRCPCPPAPTSSWLAARLRGYSTSQLVIRSSSSGTQDSQRCRAPRVTSERSCRTALAAGQLLHGCGRPCCSRRPVVAAGGGNEVSQQGLNLDRASCFRLAKAASPCTTAPAHVCLAACAPRSPRTPPAC